MHLPDLRLATFAGAAVALASGLALATLGAALLDGGGSAETLFLARWSTAVLLPAALALPAAAGELALGALGVQLAAWLLPAGAQRGAAVALALGAALALVMAARLRPAESTLRSPCLPLLALALGFFFASGALLRPRPAELLLGVAAPALLAGFAAASLAVARGAPGLVAAGAAVVAGAGPGWEVAAALAALAVGEQARLGRLRWPVTLVLLGAAALPLRDQPAVAAAVALAGAALATDRATLRLAAGAVAVAPLAFAPLHPSQPFLVLALAPAVLVATSRLAASGTRREVSPSLAGLGCALAVALAAGASALPAAVALALLVAPPQGAVLRLQAAWTGWLLAAAALVAAYPWLRPAPLASALALWRLPRTPALPDAWPLLLPAVALAAAARLARFATRPDASPRWLAPTLPVAALLAAWLASPAEMLHAGAPLVLDAERAAWSTAPGSPRPGRLTAIAIEAALSHSDTLPRGTTVATLHVVYADGRREEHPLRTAHELDEWAARRDDVAARLGPSAPAWASWVPPGGEFFAQRYRARVPLSGHDATAIELRLAAALPAPVSLALYRVEVER